jgi:hypothetical protein
MGTPAFSAIGKFVIAVSPIGDVPAFDPWTTIISEFSNSPTLDAIITSFAAAMDETLNMQAFFDMVWNVDTAQGYGLDVWGRIVGVQRTIPITGAAAQYFGFEEAGSSWTGFGQGGFYSGTGFTQNIVLSDMDFRKLILAKAFSNVCDGSIPSINKILLALFPNRGTVYVADGQDMSLTYTFNFPLTPVELAIIGQSNVLPNPAGVVVNISHP